MNAQHLLLSRGGMAAAAVIAARSAARPSFPSSAAPNARRSSNKSCICGAISSSSLSSSLTSSTASTTTSSQTNNMRSALASSPVPSPTNHHARQQGRLQHFPAVAGSGRRGLSELLNVRGGGGKGDKKRNSSSSTSTTATTMTPRRPPLRPHPISARLPVPDSIEKPPYVDAKGDAPYGEGYQIFNDAEGIAKMRASGLLAARVLDAAGELVKPGVTTDEIDKFVHKMCIENNAYPSPLTYGGFPKSVCTSVNECICHGIPDARALQPGDIVNIDVTVFLDGHHGDTSRMFYVGGPEAVSYEARRLCEVTTRALDAAIAICRPGVPFNKIGETINAIADAEKLGVVKEFVGHGVGRVFHSEPVILHCRNREPGVMKEGMAFTIEPMLCLGSPKSLMWADGWTVVTRDGGLSAQSEHTLLVTKSGVEILTASPALAAAAKAEAAEGAATGA